VRIKIVLILLTTAFLTSCSNAGQATATQPISTATPSPTFTATQPAQPLTILVLPADMPKADYDRYQTMVYNLAQAAGMRFQVRNSLTTQDLTQEGDPLKVVVALPPDPGLAELAAAAPSVQFLAIGVPGVTAGNNISTVGSNGAPVDQQAFLAGYIAGLIAPEWKVGILYQKDTPEGEAAKNAFANGFTFFCGSCRNPNFSQPAGIYPVPVGIPTDAQQSDYPAYADILYQNVVKAAFIFPAITTAEAVDRMAQRDIMIIGENLPDENARPKWVVSIQPDLTTAIQSIFPQLVEGKGGQALSTPLFLNDVNPDLLSQGKLRLAQEVLQGLQDGTISTGVTP